MPRRNHGKDWTKEDVKVLKTEARDRSISTEQIAKDLGRSVGAVRSKAFQMRVSLRTENR